MNFFKTKIGFVLLHLTIWIAAIFLVGYLSLWIVDIYTDNGKDYQVPDVQSIEAEIACEQLRNAGFRPEIIDSVHTTAVPPGTIYLQTPAANSFVKLNRRIFLTVSATGKQLVTVPDVDELTVSQAEELLTNELFKIGKKTYIPHKANDKVLEHLYNGVILKENDKAEKGASIDLVIAGGLSKEKIRMPSLYGLSKETAENLLKGNYIRIANIFYNPEVLTQEDSIKSLIRRQDPKAGTLIQKGEIVDIWFGIDEVFEETENQDNEDEIFY